MKEHDAVRNILMKYNSPEFGDAIIDEICHVFGFPDTNHKSVYDMSEVEFKEVLAEKTEPEYVFANAKSIYDFLSITFGENCSDSVLREWTFQWWADKTGNDYDKIYDKWLGLNDDEPKVS